jgi:hypothetical protein
MRVNLNLGKKIILYLSVYRMHTNLGESLVHVYKIKNRIMVKVSYQKLKYDFITDEISNTVKHGREIKIMVT